MKPDKKLRVMEGGVPTPAVDRTPPFSLEAEQHVLACCLLDGNETIARVIAEGVKPESFYSPANKTLFAVICDLWRQQPPVSLEILAAELSRRQLLDAVGSFSYLMEVTGKIPTTAHAAYFIARVRELAALRWLRETAVAMEEGVYSFTGTGEMGELEKVIRVHLGTLSRGLQRVLSAAEMPKSLVEEIDAVKKEFTERASGKVDQSGWVHTNMPAFDLQLLPFGCQRDDHYIIVGGASGDGKSALMRQWAGVALDRGQRVRIYSAETSIGGFLECLVASRTRVDLRHPDRTLRERHEKFIAECDRLKNEYADKRLWCVQRTAATPLRTIEDLADDARMFAKLQGPAQLWVVDYAQLFDTRKRFSGNREQINAYISGLLQDLVRELGGVWLVGCQLNEAGRKEQQTAHHDDDGKLIHRLPNRGDLRESQKYYHDCDRALFIYVPPEDCRGSDNLGPAAAKREQWIVQDKRRKGGRGYVRCWFETTYTNFAPFGTADDAVVGEQPREGMTKRQWKGERGGKP